jgi:hypothetical protein
VPSWRLDGRLELLPPVSTGGMRATGSVVAEPFPSFRYPPVGVRENV